MATPGAFLSQCFKCPPAQQRGVYSFRVTRPLLTPLFEAFLFSDRRLGVADSRLLIQVTGAVGRSVEAETIFGVRRQIPVIEVATLRVLFANETWQILLENLDEYVTRFPDAPVILQGQVAEVENRASFQIVRIRTAGPGFPPDTLVSIPDGFAPAKPGDFIRIWGRLRANEGGFPLVVATSVEALGDSPLSIPPVTDILGRLPGGA
jgi:hypothetical protein